MPKPAHSTPWGPTIRRLHTYLGALIAPSVLFFAATGALQLYHFHESHAGYQAPVMLRSFSAIHKDQTYTPPPEHPDDANRPQDADPLNTTVLKAFYRVVARGLIVSTLMGVWMAVRYGRRKRLIWALLVIGSILPVAILAI